MVERATQVLCFVVLTEVNLVTVLGAGVIVDVLVLVTVDAIFVKVPVVQSVVEVCCGMLEVVVVSTVEVLVVVSVSVSTSVDVAST